MDRLTAFVAIAHLRLRLERLSRNPDLLRKMILDMEKEKEKRPSLYIPRPVELAGMRARLMRASKLEKDVAATGQEYDDVMDGIDDAHKAIKGHVFDLRTVESGLRSQILGMLERSNGDPTDGESDGRQSSSGEQQQPPKPETQVIAESDVGKVTDVVKPEPAHSWGGQK